MSLGGMVSLVYDRTNVNGSQCASFSIWDTVQMLRHLIALFALTLSAQDVKLHVDASDATRRVFHVHMTIPVKPGPTTLLYPKWIPGEHMPTGPITNLVGLVVKAGGKTIPWTRDSDNMYAFHVTAPADTQSLDVVFDYISPAEGGSFSSGASTTSQLAVLSWNQLLLYPEGTPQEQLKIDASLKVPNGWRYGTALPIKTESGNELQFQTASLERLVDSPISAGANYRTIELGNPDGPSHYVHLAADSKGATEISQELIDGYKNLVVQTGKLFGARHYGSYHFLVTLSDHVQSFGLEHHESSDDRLPERSLIEAEPGTVAATLLPHEFVHSWNGKFRRPAGLATGGFDKPMEGDLLWVYEGLTNYLGEVLAARSGLWSADEYRDGLAITAAMLDAQTGRAWRPLQDTATAAQLLYEAGQDYSNFRRSVDYYPEGSLLWLETDIKIRQLSGGKKSLDDFCHAFHGAPGGKPEVKPYTFDDIVATLNQVQANDWRGFLNERLHSTSPHAPMGGITGGGWKLVFNDKQSDLWKAYNVVSKGSNHAYSIGLQVREDGTIADVVYGGPAQRAGVTPSVKIIAVNKRQYNSTVLREAIGRTAKGEKIELLVKAGEFYETYRIDYSGGERYPHLERGSGADLLSEVIAAR